MKRRKFKVLRKVKHVLTRLKTKNIESASTQRLLDPNQLRPMFFVRSISPSPYSCFRVKPGPPDPLAIQLSGLSRPRRWSMSHSDLSVPKFGTFELLKPSAMDGRSIYTQNIHIEYTLINMHIMSIFSRYPDVPGLFIFMYFLL